MSDDEPGQVTRLLEAVDVGRPGAAEALLELVYEELRRVAREKMRRVPASDTLQATALVHEAWLRLLGRQPTRGPWRSRVHFFRAAARAMRDIVVEQARRHATARRGGDRVRIGLDPALVAVEARADEVLALEEALARLERIDPRSAAVVSLRFFAGLGVEETAEALGVSAPTIKRHWAWARAWLHRELGGDARADAS